MTIYSLTAKPPVDFKTQVPLWPGQARAGQAKAELLFWSQREVLHKLNGQPVQFTLSQRLDRLGEGTPPFACCGAQITHIAKLVCHILLLLPTTSFVLFKEELSTCVARVRQAASAGRIECDIPPKLSIINKSSYMPNLGILSYSYGPEEALDGPTIWPPPWKRGGLTSSLAM